MRIVRAIRVLMCVAVLCDALVTESCCTRGPKMRIAENTENYGVTRTLMAPFWP
jgi:hypothetical protein